MHLFPNKSRNCRKVFVKILMNDGCGWGQDPTTYFKIILFSLDSVGRSIFLNQGLWLVGFFQPSSLVGQISNSYFPSEFSDLDKRSKVNIPNIICKIKLFSYRHSQYGYCWRIGRLVLGRINKYGTVIETICQRVKYPFKNNKLASNEWVLKNIDMEI